MENYIEVCSLQCFTGEVSDQGLKEVEVYSEFKVKTIPDGKHYKQTFYVPAEEKMFYDMWKMQSTMFLEEIKGNAVLRLNIARRHGLKLPK